LLALRHPDFKNAVLVSRFHLIALNLGGKPERAAERAIRAFPLVIIIIEEINQDEKELLLTELKKLKAKFDEIFVLLSS